MKLSTLAVLSALLFATACETVEGFGRDLEKGGENMEENSREAN